MMPRVRRVSARELVLDRSGSRGGCRGSLSARPRRRRHDRSMPAQVDVIVCTTLSRRAGAMVLSVAEALRGIAETEERSRQFADYWDGLPTVDLIRSEERRGGKECERRVDIG